MDQLLSVKPAARQDSAFVERYRDDPVAFIHDCFIWKDGEGPTFYQEAILADLPKYGRVCARGPHGLGKTTLNSWAILWFALTRDGSDWKIPTTASAWRQLQKYLWPEIHKWTRKINWKKVGRDQFESRRELLDLSLKLSTGEAFALASDVPDLIEGAHADNLLYIFDESKLIGEETWNSAEGAASNGNALWLATSTPGEPNGTFYEIQSKKAGYEDWKVHKVTLDDCIKAGRISPEWADARKRQWGQESAAYQNRVLGEFATSEADGVIPLSFIEHANKLWHEWEDQGSKGDYVGVGVDVARFGSDKTVFAHRYDHLGMRVIKSIDYTSKEDLMETTGRIFGILNARGGMSVVDVVGMGAGVVDRLRELNKKAVAFNASARSDMRDRSGELGFTNQRSAMWWALREMLENGEIALPDDDLLTGDLTAPHWRVVSGGNIQVESKDSIRERLHRSTDSADAVGQILVMATKTATWDDLADLGEADEDFESRWR